MKKALSVLLVLILALSMTVTGYAQEDAFTLYTEMNKAVSRVKSMEADMVMTMTMSVAGESVSVNATGNVRLLMNSETDIEMKMLMNMNVLGLQGETVEAYYKGGYLYQMLDGVMQKTKMDISELMQQSGLEASNMDFTRADVVKSSVSDVDGGKLISLVLSGEKMNEMMESVMGAQLSGVGLDGFSMKISDIGCDIVMGEDNLPVSQRMLMTIGMDVEGETVEISMDMLMNYTGFNSFFAIRYPEGIEKALEY